MELMRLHTLYCKHAAFLHFIAQPCLIRLIKIDLAEADIPSGSSRTYFRLDIAVELECQLQDERSFMLAETFMLYKFIPSRKNRSF